MCRVRSRLASPHGVLEMSGNIRKSCLKEGIYFGERCGVIAFGSKTQLNPKGLALTPRGKSATD
jgi:hypothetical protein